MFSKEKVGKVRTPYKDKAVLPKGVQEKKLLGMLEKVRLVIKNYAGLLCRNIS